MLRFINGEHLFDPNGETHYRFHTQIDLSQYPQYHDFYEVVLVTSGILRMGLCGRRFLLQPGSLALIRPGDIHTKSGSDCSHINLAFPTAAVDALFEYLCDEKIKRQMLEAAFIPPAFLTQESARILTEKIQRLNTAHTGDWKQTRTFLRGVLFDIITCHVFPLFYTQPGRQDLPDWLTDSLNAWQSPQNRQESLEFFCNYTGHTKEHICRTFKRFLGQSPTVYLNQQRLNYAVNLLLHSDYPMIDVAYESGFKSASRFYHLFRDAYGISPKQFVAQQKG